MDYKKSLTCLAMSMAALGASAQSQTVTGKIVDSDGMEVIGASISLKGTKGVGAVSDLNGNFTIKTNNAAKDVLVVSYIGMKPQEVKVNGKRQLDVRMEPNAITTDDVVVIGYGAVKRKDLTGSVSSVKSDELLKVPTNNIAQALAGRIAGLQVQSADGAPGSSISIRVRGGISISQSNEPLYVIDGFPTEDGLGVLDPASIETIDVLKDASATAIYGARGANGVIVITTKQGSQNSKASINFESYVGWRKIANKLDVLSTKEFVMADYERTLGTLTADKTMATWNSRYGQFDDIDATYDGRKGIDWQDETLGRTTFVQNYRVSVQGGNKTTQYNAAYNFFRDEGAMVYSGDRKHDVTFNFKTKVSDRLTFSARANFDMRKIWGSGTAGDGTGNYDARFNKMTSILQYRPTAGIKGDDASLLEGEDPILADDSGNTMQNPLITAREELNDREYRTFSTNGDLTYTILKGLTWRTAVGYRYQTRRYDVFYGDESVTAKRSSINGTISNYEYETFQVSNTLSYNKRWKKLHNLTALIGQEFISRSSRSVSASANQFPNDDIGLGDMSLGTPTSITSSKNYDDNIVSFFGRVNYNYADKYLLTASLRADGSSKFGKNNKWGYFPAVSAAWRLSEEEFIKKLGVFSDLKLRAGYGLAGNNRIGSYNSLAILSSVFAAVGNSLGTGYASKQIPNADLKWEANKTFNLGIDLGFFNQRLTIAPEFYVNKSSNLLLNANIPYSSGYGSMIINAGKTKNTGVDLTINSVNFDKPNFTWRTALTMSHNKNTVEALTGEQSQLYEARFGFNLKTHKLEVGKSIGQFYGYVTDGIYTMDDFNVNEDGTYGTLKDGIPYHDNKNNVKPGKWKFKDIDGNGTIGEEDKVVIGNATPDLYGGLNNTFAIGNVDLSIYLTYSIGADVLNATKLINSKIGSTNRNSLDCMSSSHRWVTINERGEIENNAAELARINAGKTVAAYYDCFEGNNYIHSWAVEDASFLRLSNITLGYTFPSRMMRRLGVRKLRLYATANNLLTITGYKGYDPEVSTMSSALTPGVDYGSYPRSRSFIVGVNLSF